MPAAASRLSAGIPALFVLLWSTGFIGARLGLPHAPPLSFLLTRYLLVIGCLGALALAARAPWPREPRQIGHIAVAGLLIQATYLGGVFSAIHAGMSAGMVALIVGTQPLVTAALAGWWLGERVGARQWTGLAMGMVGVGLVVADKLGASGSVGAVAAALVALAGITLGTLYQKRFCPHFDLRTGSVVQFAASALVTAPLAALETEPIRWHGEFVFALLWLTLVLSLGAISLLNLLIRRGEASRVASLFYLTPPITALMAWALFDERLSALALAGMLLAAGGVALAIRR